MVSDKFLLVSMDDEMAKSLADVLGNKTCKKIIEFLAEKSEASEKDISSALKIPMNTVEDNLKKLLKSGFVQKRKNFFWSKKGKKILMYELSNKSIVISPKNSAGSKAKSLLPSAILLLAGTFALWVYERVSSVSNLDYGKMVQEAGSMAIDNLGAPFFQSPQPTPLWVWFFAGGLITLFIFAIVNWRKL
ncbi:MAG: helix-turn-helix domain-containing protein [archaeon]|nr:helix-turn-helix domain-containing protein [archaeon]